MMKIFGIKNCDKVRKTLKWFEANAIDYTFHDFRKDGIDNDLIAQFKQHFELEQLFNKRSTTWRQLSEAEKTQLSPDLLITHPTLIPRPVVISGSFASIGYKPELWKNA